MIIEEEQEKACCFIEKTIKDHHKLSHAYLIETNGYSSYMLFVKKMMKMILSLNQDNTTVMKINYEIDQDQYPDIRYIIPDGLWIKKEQLISLEKEFSKKSMLDNQLIYVIDGAEKLNDSSANTILKFLEEPKEGIIAILIANNRYKVIDTILSRCQIIALTGQAMDVDDIDDYLLDFCKHLSHQNYLMIHYDDYFSHLFSTKQEALKTVETLEKSIYYYINDYSLSEKLYDTLKQYSIRQLINYLLVISEEKIKLEYNVNLKLWLNLFIIRIMEVSNV